MALTINRWTDDDGPMKSSQRMMFAGVVGFWLSVVKSSVGLLVEEFLTEP